MPRMRSSARSRSPIMLAFTSVLPLSVGSQRICLDIPQRCKKVTGWTEKGHELGKHEDTIYFGCVLPWAKG